MRESGAEALWRAVSARARVEGEERSRSVGLTEGQDDREVNGGRERGGGTGRETRGRAGSRMGNRMA